MPAIGFGLLWAGYALGLLGWAKLQGYEVTFGELVIPGRMTSWPPQGAIGKSVIPFDQIPKDALPPKTPAAPASKPGGTVAV